MSLLHTLGANLFEIPWKLFAVLFALTYSLTIADVSLYLHRSMTHGAVSFHPILQHFFRFWIWCTTGMIVREWVAVHRYHHSKCETEDDPHSPEIHGLKNIVLNGVAYYKRCASNELIVSKYGVGTPDDWIERHLYANERSLFMIMGFTFQTKWLGFVLFWALTMVIFAIATSNILQGIGLGMVFSGLQMIIIPLMAAGVVNGLGHAFGYRTFDTPDNSHNILPIGILIGGEELHNNHHAFPQSARFSIQKWELDIGWMCLMLLKFLRMVKIDMDRLGTLESWKSV
jgi:stearoyl-CoA desaturase (Delta-9 desaturase)